eukprot:scaffold63046_cov62-Phaeocystis_antarctica.AAC.3
MASQFLLQAATTCLGNMLQHALRKKSVTKSRRLLRSGRAAVRWRHICWPARRVYGADVVEWL